MLRGWLGLAACAATLPVLAGCGGSGTSTTEQAVGEVLTVYSSLPLGGTTATISGQVVGGEKLALAETGGRVNRFKVALDSLDDSDPTTGRWTPGTAANNAKTAAQDTSTIGYIGELDSGATAITLPILNEAGILQVSPASPYVGLTQAHDAGQDEPGRFYPTARQTFARLMPGDPVQARAQIALMRSLHVRSLYVLDDQDPFQTPLAQLVASEAAHAGIAVVGQSSQPLGAVGLSTSEVQKIAESGAQAVFVASAAAEGAAALWRALHAYAPQIQLLAPATLAEQEAFTSQLGSAAQVTWLTTPLLPSSSYPADAQRVLAAYRRQFGAEGSAWVLYGYESMRSILGAVRAAGSQGNQRRAVIAKLFARPVHPSVIGPFRFEPNGDTSSTRYAVDRVRGGHPVLVRVLP